MPAPEVLGFGVFELDVKSGELRKQGRKVRLADQPFQVLRLLVDRPGDIVTRDELRQALWSSDTFVDFDTGLSSAVRKLRDALGDAADNPTFIETVPKRGYRFIAPIVPRNGNEHPAAPPMPVPVSAPATPSRAPRIAAFLAAAGVVAIAVYGLGRREHPARAASNSLAVLPFENLTGDTEQQYIVDGFTDGLTTALAQNGRLQVISRRSAMQYRGTQKAPRQIGGELGVHAIVLGSVVRVGDRLRVTAQIVDTATDQNVWAHNYDSRIEDLLTLQDQIGATIARTLGADAETAASPALAHRSINGDAYLQYLHGITRMGRGSYAGFENAVVAFENAIERQPDFALAHAQLAFAQTQLLFGAPIPPREIVPKAEAAARNAIALDDSVALAHRILGELLHDYYWNWSEGDREFERARALDPNSVETLMEETGRLIRAKRYDEALAVFARARQLDPLSVDLSTNVGGFFRTAGQYDRAIESYRESMRIDPDNRRTRFQLGLTYLAMGRCGDALHELEVATSRLPDNLRFWAYRGYASATCGRRGDAEGILARLETEAQQKYVSSFGIALIHEALGHKAAALHALERAYDEHAVDFSLSYLRFETLQPRFQTLQGEPRFDEIMRAVSRH